MEGESLNPNSNITMNSALMAPLPHGSIDPTDYYGQSFDYNEWTKSKIKEIEKENQVEYNKQQRAIEDRKDAINSRLRDSEAKSREYEQSKEFKDSEQKYKISEAERLKAEKDEYNERKEAFRQQAIRGDRWLQGGIRMGDKIFGPDEYDAFVKADITARGGIDTSPTTVTGESKYLSAVESYKKEIDTVRSELDKAKSLKEIDELSKKLDSTVNDYDKLLNSDRYSKFKTEIIPFKFIGTTSNQQGGGAAENTAYMSRNVAATSAQTANILGAQLTSRSTAEQKADVAKANLDADIFDLKSKQASILGMYQGGKDANGNPLTEGQKSLLNNTYNEMQSKLNIYDTGNTTSQLQLKKLQDPYGALASNTVGSVHIGTTPSLDKTSGNEIYGSRSGEMVVTEDKKTIPLSTITDLLHAQHGTGDYGKHSDRYQDGSKVYIPMINSIKAKKELYTLLKNPNIKDPFATPNNTFQTKEMKDNLPIVNYDQKDYILPKSGLPILLSDYMTSSKKDKEIMSKTPAENFIGDNYNEVKDKFPVLIDIINEMPKYGGAVMADGNLLGSENLSQEKTFDKPISNFDKIINSYNQESYRDPNSLIRDMKGNVFPASYINNEGRKIDYSFDPKDITRDEQGNKYINQIGTANVPEMGLISKSGEIIPYNKNLQDSSNFITTNPITGYSSDITGLITPTTLSSENKNYKSIISQLGRQFVTGSDQKIDLGLGSSVKLYPEDKKVLPVNDIQNYMSQRNQISKLAGASFQKQDQPGITGLKNVLTRVSMPDVNMGNLGKKNTSVKMFRKSKSSKPKINIKKSKKSVPKIISGFNFDKLVSNVSMVKEKNEKEKSEKKLSGLKFNFDFKIPKIDISLKKKRVK